MAKSDDKITRRAFVTQVGGTVVGIGLPGIFLRLLQRESLVLAGEMRADGRPRLPPGQRAVKRIIDMGGIRGSVTAQDWRLRIHGELEQPMTLGFEELLRLPQTELTCDVHCVTGWTLLDSHWQGVRVSAIMELVRVKESARFTIFEAAAGYTSNIPITEARKENVILAHSFFSKSLSLAHGGPVRALVPDLYFYKSAKWLEGIKFVVRDEPGYWERQGYSNSADPWKEERFQ